MNNEFSIEQIQALMKSVSEYQLGELLYECEGVRLRIKGRATGQPQAADAAPGAPGPTVIAAVSSVQNEAPSKEADASKLIASPIVGTFYASSAPDREPFVKVGQHVSKGDTVFIVESMKVMNEVPAEIDGIVEEILVENGQSVEYGQPVLRLR